MMLATIEKIDNVELEKTLGVVSAIGMYSAGSQITGGMTVSSDEAYDKCFEETMNKVIEKGEQLNADGRIGITVAYVSKDSTRDMCIQISGTAVRFKKTKELTKMKNSYYDAQTKAHAAKENEGQDYEMAMMTGAVAAKSPFEESCEKIAEHFDLSDEMLEVIKAFEVFGEPRELRDLQRKVTFTDDRGVLLRIASALVDKEILVEEAPYYKLKDLAGLKIL